MGYKNYKDFGISYDAIRRAVNDPQTECVLIELVDIFIVNREDTLADGYFILDRETNTRCIIMSLRLWEEEMGLSPAKYRKILKFLGDRNLIVYSIWDNETLQISVNVQTCLNFIKQQGGLHE